MRAIVLALAAGAASVAGAAAPAQDQRAECAVQAAIVMRVVESRAEGREAGATTRAVQSGLSGEAENYAGVVPAVVDWVYTLPEDRLGRAVGESWTEACIAR